MKKLHTYGPVPSRRFGLSLGVDVVPHKTCCYDCVYCQLGKTTDLRVERLDFYPLAEILGDVKSALEAGPLPDVITLAGSGDASLYASLGSLLKGIHELSDIPILLLTNGGLLFKDEVARDVMQADILSPSLDAGDPETFQRINQPDRSISFTQMYSGLQTVTKNHPGKVQLEVMLAKDVNDSADDIAQIASCLEHVRKDSIDINTPVRPVPDRPVFACSATTLKNARDVFGQAARIIANYSGRTAEALDVSEADKRIFELLSRRPCTVDDLHNSLGLHRNQILKVIARAVESGVVEERVGNKNTYYFVVK
ncbi:MAG: radical SAM protein [Deltaproteobacteria bacterium]|nr:radical SAM protein [Deltaproteobacteria bacterium]